MVGNIHTAMVGSSSLVLATALVFFATAPKLRSQVMGNTGSAIMLRQRVEQSCELLRRGTLLPEEGYVAVRVDGVPEEIYSPELGKDDFIEVPSGTPVELVKAAKRSGFRMKRVSDSELAGLPKIEGRERDSTCPSLEKGLQIAGQDLVDRRRQLQSTLFRSGWDGVTTPEALDTPQPQLITQEASSSSQSSQAVAGTRGKPRQGTVVLLVVVSSKGDVEQTKVVKSISPDIDREAVRTASGWKFKPAKKNGLPVPVQIIVEVEFKLR
jgi:TonB family protein